MPFKARVQYQGATDDVNFWVVDTDRPDGKRRIARVSWEEYEPGLMIDPTLTATWDGPSNSDFLQAVVDAAYEVGIRPRAANATGENAALRNHVSDLRSIAFGVLKIAPPK